MTVIPPIIIASFLAFGLCQLWGGQEPKSNSLFALYLFLHVLCIPAAIILACGLILADFLLGRIRFNS